MRNGKVDLFDACAVVVLNDSLPSSCDHRCVVIKVGEVWGPLHWAPGIEWITESPRAVFKGLIGLGAATTTPASHFHFASPPITSPTPQPQGHRLQLRKIFAIYAPTPLMHTAASPTPIPGEGAHHPTPHPHIMEDMDARQGPSNPYPLQTKILGKFWTPYRQMAESLRKYTPRNAGK